MLIKQWLVMDPINAKVISPGKLSVTLKNGETVDLTFERDANVGFKQYSLAGKVVNTLPGPTDPDGWITALYVAVETHRSSKRSGGMRDYEFTQNGDQFSCHYKNAPDAVRCISYELLIKMDDVILDLFYQQSRQEGPEKETTLKKIKALRSLSEYVHTEKADENWVMQKIRQDYGDLMTPEMTSIDQIISNFQPSKVTTVNKSPDTHTKSKQVSNEDVTSALQVLENRGPVGDSIKNTILRLQKGQASKWNPYWMNSSTKLAMIVKAVNKLDGDKFPHSNIAFTTKIQIFIRP